MIPAKNEKESLGKVLDELSHFDFISKIIIIVDKIDDNSIKVVKNKNCKVLIQSNSTGYGAAIIEGFKIVKTDLACIYNADFSFDPNYLPIMIEKSKKFDFIFGTRYKKKGSSDDDNIVTFVGNYIFTFMSKFFLKIKLSDILYTYVLCNVKKFNKINFTKKDFRFCIELPYHVKINSFKYTELAMKERKRWGGDKNVNVLKDGFLILLEIIRCFFKKI